MNDDKEILWSRRKKDFIIDWFNGTGKGGQHRNKNACCCRLKDKETGIQTVSTEHKSASMNLKSAFRKMVDLLQQHYSTEEFERKNTAGFGGNRVRTYNEVQDRIVDEDTKEKYSYRQTVGKGDISDLIRDRALKLNKENK